MELIYHCGMGYPLGALNQGIDVPHRYPKMGDWSATYHKCHRRMTSLPANSSIHTPCICLKDQRLVSFIHSHFISVYFWYFFLNFYLWHLHKWPNSHQKGSPSNSQSEGLIKEVCHGHFFRIPQDSFESCRNLWGTEKYWTFPHIFLCKSTNISVQHYKHVCAPTNRLWQ